MSAGVFYIITFWSAIGIALGVCLMLSRHWRVNLPVLLFGIAGGLAGARLISAFETGSGTVWEGGWSSLGFGLGFFSVTLGIGLVMAGFEGALEFADLTAPALAAGGVIARIGCFVAGCHFGTVTELPWGIQYPAGTSAFFHQIADRQLSLSASQSLPVHPVALLESVLLLLGLTVYFVTPSKRLERIRPGIVFLLWALYYSTIRFGLEFLRGGSIQSLGPFSLAQFACLCGIGIGILALTVFPTLEGKLLSSEAAE